MSIWQWAQFLPPIPPSHQFSLGEGNTPLLRSRHLGPQCGLSNLFFKLESVNPTGSYKDRFAAVAVSEMQMQGKTRCLATSSGNTGSALAAYCAAAAISCEIDIVETAPAAKLGQMLAYGARLQRVRRFGTSNEVTEAVMNGLKRRGEAADAKLLISAYAYSPVAMAGVQTIAYELAGAVADVGAIDHVFCPAGGGGLTLAVARGFVDAVAAGFLRVSPRIECVQPAGNDTIASRLVDGFDTAQAVACTTLISGLQVASVLDGDAVIAACRASGGSGHIVSDEEVWETQKLLARGEGIWSEPAGAVAVAAALQAVRQGRVGADAKIVCLVTGSGSKDAASLDRLNSDSECPIVDPPENL